MIFSNPYSGNDISTTGTFTVSGQTVAIPFAGHNSAAFVLSGTWTGTVVVDGSADGTTWTSLWFTQIGNDPVFGGIPQTQLSCAANGTYRIFNTTGLTNLRVRSSAVAWTGSTSITLTVVSAVPSHMYTNSSITQQVYAEPNNTSSTNLTSGNNYTFTGIGTSTLGVAGIQVALYTDKNAIVKVQQSLDSINWDITDTYSYYASGNFGLTVQAVSSYYRLIVSTAALTTSVFRLGTALCPIIEVLPRSLDSNGDLQVAIQSTKDSYGFSVENTPNGEVRSIEPIRLVGAAFEGTTIDSTFWTAGASGVGTSVAVGNAQVTLTSGVSGNTSLWSFRRGRYLGGTSMRYRGAIQVPDYGVTNNKRRWGIGYCSSTIPSITDGAYFQMSGTTFGIRIRKTNTETASLAVDTGSFNGVLGTTYTPGTGAVTYEIYWTSSKVYFVIGDQLLHTITSLDTTWADTLSFHSFLDNVCSAATTSSLLRTRSSTIYRLGKEETAPIYKNVGAATTQVLKYGPGRLHAVIPGTYTNGATITIYDSIGATTNTISLATFTSTNTGPITLDYSVDFYTGLCVSTSNVTSATFIFE